MTGPNLPLEDVLHELIRTEPDPSYAVLMRWCRRHPQYSEDLAGFFLWAVQSIRGGRPQQLLILDDEERLASGFDSGEDEDYALDILRREATSRTSRTRSPR